MTSQAIGLESSAVQTRTMTKVLYFSSASHVQGGAVQSMFRLARWLKQQGGEPVVVLPRDGGIREWYAKAGIEVRVLPFEEMHQRITLRYLLRYLFSTLSIIARLIALIRRERIDIVHVNEIVYFPGLIASKLAGAKTVCHVRVIIQRPLWLKWALSWIVSRFSDQVLCVSSAVRVQMFALEQKRVRTLYNPGPDLERFDPAAVGDGQALRQQFGIPLEAFVVGLVSKLSPNKGHMALIQTARLLKVQQPTLPIHYLIIGGEVAGKEGYAQQVAEALEQYDLQDAFTLAGMQSDVPQYIAACDVMVHLPSIEDPFPGVVLEALAMGKPIVAFGSGGIPEQFENGKSGILVEKNNLAALAKALTALAQDPARRQQLGQAARPYLMAHFSLQRFSAELADVYHRL